jgi:hypothetical protein
VAGIDLASERHWVCAPTVDGAGREIAHFGATTPELMRMGKWLQERKVESVAMESTGVYWSVIILAMFTRIGHEQLGWAIGTWISWHPGNDKLRLFALLNAHNGTSVLPGCSTRWLNARAKGGRSPKNFPFCHGDNRSHLKVKSFVASWQELLGKIHRLAQI